MRTVTNYFTDPDSAMQWIVDGEDRGWSVRSITQKGDSIWVVQEKPVTPNVHKKETKWHNRAAQYLKGLAE